MTLRNASLLALCLMFLLVGPTLGADKQSDAKLQQLVNTKKFLDLPSFYGKAARDQPRRRRKLSLIWLSRTRRDVTSEVVPFLQDPDADIRESTARALVRLTNPSAKQRAPSLLRALLTKPKVKGHVTIDPFVLKLALGYDRSRNLRGQKRLNVLAESVGLSWSQIIRLSQIYNQRSPHLQFISEAEEVMDEFVRVLLEMGKRGENIKPFDKQLTLSPAQHVLLQTASLKPANRITSILNYLLQPDSEGYDQPVLTSELLLDNDPYLVGALAKSLTAFKKQPQKAGRDGYNSLFRTAACTGAPRLLRMLKSIEEDSHQDRFVRYRAMQARLTAERKDFPSALP